MNEKRFRQFGLWVIDDPNLKINTVADLFDTKIMSIEEVVDLLNEQQATISALTKENKELGKNFEDLVEWVSGIAKRNVVLDEKIGELQRENEQLRQQLKEKEEDEQLYANEIVKLNKEAKEVLDFKSLGGDY